MPFIRLALEIDNKVEMTRRSATKSLTCAGALRPGGCLNAVLMFFNPAAYPVAQATTDEAKTQFVKAASGFALVTRRASALQFLTADDMAQKRISRLGRLAPVAE